MLIEDSTKGGHNRLPSRYFLHFFFIVNTGMLQYPIEAAVQRGPDNVASVTSLLEKTGEQEYYDEQGNEECNIQFLPWSNPPDPPALASS